MSSELPNAVDSFLATLLATRLYPAYVRVAADGLVTEMGGELVRYQLGAVEVGASVEEQVPLLTGMLPLSKDSAPFLLPWVNTDAGGFMDVWLLPDVGGDYVICIEAAADQQERVLIQQKHNELALTKRRQGQILESHVGKYVAEQLLDGGMQLRAAGERREATLLFCDIRGFTGYAEQVAPEEVFATLSQYLSAMVQPILDHGGWLDKLAGDAVYAAFGLIPSPMVMSAAHAALAAAQQIMRNIFDVGQERIQKGQLALGVGIGIATGAVAVGILGTQERRQFAVIGHHVNLAARLQAQAQSGEIVIDTATLTALGSTDLRFTPRALRLKGVSGDFPSHVLALDSPV